MGVEVGGSGKKPVHPGGVSASWTAVANILHAVQKHINTHCYILAFVDELRMPALISLEY